MPSLLDWAVPHVLDFFLSLIKYVIPKRSDKVSKKNDLRTFFKKMLLFFKEDTCYDYSIDAWLKRYNKDFFQCTIAYKYTKKINNKKLLFRINRMSKEEHLEHLQHLQHLQKSKNRDDVSEVEYSMDFDELNFYDKTKNWPDNKIKELLYDIKNLVVSVDGKTEEENIPIPLSMISKDGECGRELLFSTGELPEKFIGKMVTLQYTVECIFEKTSYVYFDTDLPTKAFSLRFDYREVKDEIAIDCVDFLSSYKCASIGYRPNNNVFNLTNREEWVIPKSGFIVIWSEKKNLPKELNLMKGVFE